MTETTTIEITKAQKERLDRLKESRQSYKDALEALFAQTEDSRKWTEDEIRSIARQESQEILRQYQ